MEQNKTSFGSSLMLLLAAFIWGVAFVAQSVGMDYMGPCTFNGARFLIGSLVLVPVILFRAYGRGKQAAYEDMGREAVQDVDSDKRSIRQSRRDLVVGGLCCGLALCCASLLQQVGIQYTTVGKAGFLTTLYIVIVPVLGIFVRKKVSGRVWIGAMIAVIGMYLLCVTEGFSIGRGDILVLLCALVFSGHILAVDYFSPRVDSVKLSCLQFLVSGLICMIAAFLTEKPSWDALASGALPLLYAGVLSCGVAYTLQVVGQKKVEPTVASLLLSLESVFSVLAGWAILGQQLSVRELLGCCLVFAAVVLVQLPGRQKARA